MTATAQVLDTYPADLGAVDEAKLAACVDACFECTQVCTACADACLSEEMVAELTTCIRTNADCADVCDTTGRVLSRHTGYDADPPWTAFAVWPAAELHCNPGPRKTAANSSTAAQPCTTVLSRSRLRRRHRSEARRNDRGSR